MTGQPIAGTSAPAVQLIMMTKFVGDCCDKLLVVKHDGHQDIDAHIHDNYEDHDVDVDGVYQLVNTDHNNHIVFIRNTTQSDKYYIYYDISLGWVLATSLTNYNFTGSYLCLIDTLSRQSQIINQQDMKGWVYQTILCILSWYYHAFACLHTSSTSPL